MESHCPLCNKLRPISAAIGVCVDCLRQGRASAPFKARETHRTSRQKFGLPPEPPRAADGVRCTVCTNECEIGPGQRGFCGLRKNISGRLQTLAGSSDRGLLEWYRDPLPTNCVADWVCPGHGQPGKHNLAVFYAACSFDCLFCQNWHFRAISADSGPCLSAEGLAEVANPNTFCVCYFGGDPSPQMAHALTASRRLAEQGVHVCWETNGSMSSTNLRRALELSLASGGCIKFDLKAWNENLHVALTGASNKRTLENFARAAGHISKRPDPPLLVASTLLVPGYIDPAEVGAVARFIASLDPTIPYSLLAFAPQFEMRDLPCTSRDDAGAALEAASAAGLTRVHLGNRHLLGMG